MPLWAREQRLGKLIVRPEYLDLTGDLVSGLLLSQIVYWFRPNKNGGTAIKVFRDGRGWIAKTREEWCAELRIGMKQLRAALPKLEGLGLIEQQVFKYGGRPVLHIGLNLEALIEAVAPAVSTKPAGQSTAEAIDLPTVPIGHNPLCQNVTIKSAQTASSYVEQSTTESTKEKPAVSASAKPVENLMTTLKDLQLQHHLKKQSPALCWNTNMAKAYGGFQAPLTLKEQGQLKSWCTWVEQHADALGVMNWVINTWQTAAKTVQTISGLDKTPLKPNIGWCLQHKQELLNAWNASMIQPEAVQLIAPTSAKPPEVPQELQVFTPEQIDQALKDL